MSKEQSAYYVERSTDNPDWLDSELGIEDYAHRGVPNIFPDRGRSEAAARSTPRTSAIPNTIALWSPATSLRSILRHSARRPAAFKRLLLDETPIIAAYFYDWLSVTTKRIRGVRPTAMGICFSIGHSGLNGRDADPVRATRAVHPFDQLIDDRITRERHESRRRHEGHIRSQGPGSRSRRVTRSGTRHGREADIDDGLQWNAQLSTPPLRTMKRVPVVPNSIDQVEQQTPNSR